MQPEPGITEHDVLAVLGGADPSNVLRGRALTVDDLGDAVERYRTAGRTALGTHDRDWYQVRLRFADWAAAEAIAAELLPRLRAAITDGRIRDWWFVRKHPHWRLRHRTGTDDPTHIVAAILDPLVTANQLTSWWPTRYEPETLVFGGPAGMDHAHRLFHADSDGLLDHLTRPAPPPGADRVGRVELSVILCTALLRAARLDPFEQADVWYRVTRLRPTRTPTPTGDNSAALRRLVNTDPHSLTGRGGPLAHARDHLTAFTDAGTALADAARDGDLHRGLRDVLAHHVIFHWNRAGLPDHVQKHLAAALCDVCLNVHLDGVEPGR